ncbi:MAG TPA: hypothetical protein DCQ98_15880, partial [Planctomycetaceae bacterium]|nr:hypothetical protein [Planctomycetaceae bacterium]
MNRRSGPVGRQAQPQDMQRVVTGRSPRRFETRSSRLQIVVTVDALRREDDRHVVLIRVLIARGAFAKERHQTLIGAEKRRTPIPRREHRIAGGIVRRTERGERRIDFLS